MREREYNEAMTTLGSLGLDVIVKDLSKTKTKYKAEIKQIIRCYRDMSETHIISLRDLLRFMLTVKSSRAPVPKITDTYSAAADSTSSALTSRNSTKHTLTSKSNSTQQY